MSFPFANKWKIFRLNRENSLSAVSAVYLVCCKMACQKTVAISGYARDTESNPTEKVGNSSSTSTGSVA